MRMKEANRSPGTGSTVTLSRKADGVKRNPEPTTERGKRRAAIRRRRAAAAEMASA